MRVVVSTPGKFHSFHLARQMERHGALTAIFSAYPRFKLTQEGIPPAKLHTYGWFHAPYMALPRRDLLGTRVSWGWEWLTKTTFDRHVARHLPDCDVFAGMSGSALLSGQAAQSRGGRFVCDRGSAHIRVQDDLLRREHEAWGLPFRGIDHRVVEQEEAEYQAADCITLPSTFAWRSFTERGISPGKLRLLPYGVDLGRFRVGVGAPLRDAFNVIFIGAFSLQKGVPYLLQAYRQLRHRAKSLTFVGARNPALVAVMRQRGLWDDAIRTPGHVPNELLARVIARSHVLVLPSIQDGFGMVMTEAMACARPVIASTHSGGPDLITEGVDGFVVPARDAEALHARLQLLADDPELVVGMGRQARIKAARRADWSGYGDLALSTYSGLVQ